MTTRDRDYTDRSEKSKQNKLPSFQFYPGDWRKDPGIQALSFHDRGVWFEILVLMHESSERGALMLNNKPMPIEGLARLLGLDNQILNQTLTTLLDYGVASVRESDGAIINRRMVRDEHIRQVRTSAGLLGGNPNLLKQKSTTQVKQISTPSSSSSSSSSSSNNIINKELKPRTPKIQKIEVEPDVWLSQADLEAARIAHGAPQTTEMLKAISDYQLATGKRYKDHAAVLRQWFRRAAQKPTGNAFRPHTAAATAEKNLAYMKERYGTENLSELFDTIVDGQKKPSDRLHDGGGLVPELDRPK